MKKLLTVKTLLPVPEHFPVQLDGTERMACDLLPVVASQMDVEPGSISLDFYNEQLLEIRGDAGFTLYGQQYDAAKAG